MHARGGDHHILRVLRNWICMHRITIVIPRIGFEYTNNILGRFSNVSFISSSSNSVWFQNDQKISLIKSYVTRLLSSLLFVKRDNYDVVVAASHLSYDLVPAYVLSRRSKSKFVVYVHHILGQRSLKPGISDRLRLLLGEHLTLRLCRYANLIFVNNVYIREYLVAKGFDHNNIVVTKNGIDFHLISHQGMTDNKSFDACFCGSLTVMKGIYDLIYAWNSVVRMYPKAKLVLIGEGDEKSRMESIISERSLTNNIMILGYVSDERKYAVMKGSKLYVSCSFEEGWGMAVTEALACGTPAVCYDLAAYRVFGESVTRVNVGDKELMANKICELLSNEEQIRDLSRKGKVVVNKFDWNQISKDELHSIEGLF